MGEKPIRYSDFVNYKVMDAVKALMLKTAERTHHNIDPHSVLIPESKGGSVFLFREGSFYRGLVLEQLGTKNKAAEIMRKLTGVSYFRNTAIDTAATIFNDSSTAGLRAQMGVMFIAAGSEEWFKDAECVEDYAYGWQRAFDESECVWGGGETGTLGALVYPDTAVLAGAVMGKATEQQVLLPSFVRPGDIIVILYSNGVHANGISALRALAEDKARMPQGYLTTMSDGRTFGEALLDPTPLYGKVIRACQARIDRPIHWAINISGHAWRKLMRAPRPLRYVIHNLPPRQPIHDFMQRKMQVDDREMLGNYTCGGGYALFVPPEHATSVVAISRNLGIGADVAGEVLASEEKSVHLSQKNITWGPKDLDL